MIERLAYIFLGISLVVCSVFDIRTKKIPIYSVGMILLAGLGVFLSNPHEIGWKLRLFGLIAGLVMCAISKISKEAVGLGDSIMICVLGLVLGLVTLSVLLLISFGLLMFVSVFLFLVKRVKAKDRIPYIPFLLAGYLFWTITGGILYV